MLLGFVLTAVILAAAQAAIHPPLHDSAPLAADSQLRSPIAAGSSPRIFPKAQASDAAARNGKPTFYPRVRSTQRETIALIAEGAERSATFRSLVDALQQSNVIVLVDLGFCAGGRIRSCLVSVSGSAKGRHVRIRVDPRTTNDRLIATIAHELQHAVEIAERPDVFDGPATLELYREIGMGRCREGLSEECETAHALATEGAVLDELMASRESAADAPSLPLARA